MAFPNVLLRLSCYFLHIKIKKNYLKVMAGTRKLFFFLPG